MGGLLSKPKAVTAPPVSEPPPPPTIQDTEEAGDIEKRRHYRRGRKETFLTGDLAPEVTGKKRLLGG